MRTEPAERLGKTTREVLARPSSFSRNSWRFVGLDDFGREYGRGLSYFEMTNSFPFAIIYPYDVSLMIFYEVYAMAVRWGGT